MFDAAASDGKKEESKVALFPSSGGLTTLATEKKDQAPLSFGSLAGG